MSSANLTHTDITRDAIDKRGELIRARLSDLRPDLTTALALLGIAILQLKSLGTTDSSIRESVEQWIAQTLASNRAGLWKPDTARLTSTVTDWLKRKRNRKH